LIGIASNVGDQEWLIRRFSTMFDMLHETRAFQELIEEGRKEGIEEGLQRGKLEALHETTLSIVKERFPKLMRFAKKQVAAIEDPKVFQQLILKLISAQTMNEAKQYLLAVDKDEDGDDE